MTDDLPRLSVVCVWNDPAVRAECLDSSFRDADPATVEYLPIENVGQRFTSAGAALNHGARLARHEVVVMVHQDVHLHSLERLREVARELLDGTWGVLGACGIGADGAVIGTVRDRVQLIGRDAPVPVDVDSLDEVLFMVRRDRLLTHPLSEAPQLAWHAYAVEYGARMRRLGLRVGAVTSAVTHNSMTINLDKLDVAHSHLGAAYGDLLPLRTTCGVIAGPQARPLHDSSLVRRHGWRRRWLHESRLALRAGRSTYHRSVLADIRIDVDALDWPRHAPLTVVNLDPDRAFADSAAPLTLNRAGRPVLFTALASVDEAARVLAGAGREESFLVTNLRAADVRHLTRALASSTGTRLGVHERDLWLLVGPVADGSPAEWSSPRSVPLLA